MAKTFRVGIDLAPASRLNDAPGTAVHVREQVHALLQLDVPWEWVPVAESSQNPLLDIASRWNPTVVSHRSIWRRATFCLNAEWQRRHCNLGFATAFFVPLRGIPVVTNFFDAGMFTPEYAKTWISGGHRWNFQLVKTLGTYALWRSSRIFIGSDYWRQLLVRKFPRLDNKVVVARCGIRPAAPPVSTVPTWAAVLQKPHVLFAGAFSDNKNQFRLLQVWRMLQKEYPDFPALILIGPCGANYFQKRIAPLIADLPRPHEVFTPGVVSDQDLAWAYQNSCFYVQPSFMEGFGMPIVEAMSYGIPVACSNTTSLPETAGGASLLFAPDQLESMRQVVESLWKDVSLREKLSTAGLEHSRQFTWAKNAQIVAAQIETTLKELT